MIGGPARLSVSVTLLVVKRMVSNVSLLAISFLGLIFAVRLSHRFAAIYRGNDREVITRQPPEPLGTSNRDCMDPNTSESPVRPRIWTCTTWPIGTSARTPK